jgi:predicted MPP superfamily phosphohydrolase
MTLAGIAVLLLAISGYAMLVEPVHPRVKTILVREGMVARRLLHRKVAVISDLHFGAGAKAAEAETLKTLEEVGPDLILLAGDYVAWGARGRAYERAFDFLSRLEAPLGVYAVLGDADRTFSRKSCEFCHAAGSGAPTSRHRVVFLKNQDRIIALPGGPLRIVGLEPDFSRPAGQQLRSLLAGDLPTILISHSSIVYREIDPSVEVLTVSGDTHGGQVWMPRWFWRLTRFKPDPEHIAGFFHDGRKSLLVSRGIGTSHVPFRLGAPPEVVILEFAGTAEKPE